MVTKAKVLDNPVVDGAKGAKHEAHLQCQINEDAPHFELGKYAGESGFERDDGLGVGLFDVDKVEDVRGRGLGPGPDFHRRGMPRHRRRRGYALPA